MPGVPHRRAADAAVFLQQQLSDRADQRRDADSRGDDPRRADHPHGRPPHAPSRIRSWLGDSIGRWEGNTLVVDTTNFNDGGGFYGDAGGNFGWDRNLHLIERFSLFDADTLLYQFEIDNPTAFTQPWKGELTMTRSTEPIYEYACHEGELFAIEHAAAASAPPSESSANWPSTPLALRSTSWMRGCASSCPSSIRSRTRACNRSRWVPPA